MLSVANRDGDDLPGVASGFEFAAVSLANWLSTTATPRVPSPANAHIEIAPHLAASGPSREPAGKGSQGPVLAARRDNPVRMVTAPADEYE